jgi:hypothetical protein
MTEKTVTVMRIVEAGSVVVEGATEVAAATADDTESAAPVMLKTIDAATTPLLLMTLRAQRLRSWGVLGSEAEPMEIATKKTKRPMRLSWWVPWRGGRRKGGVAMRTMGVRLPRANAKFGASLMKSHRHAGNPVAKRAMAKVKTTTKMTEAHRKRKRTLG